MSHLKALEKSTEYSNCTRWVDVCKDWFVNS